MHVQHADRPESGCQITEDYVNFISLADWTLQAADPLQLADQTVDRFGTDAILMQVGVPDIVVPNSTSLALASGYGLSTTDDMGPYQQYDFSMLEPLTSDGTCHGFLLSPGCGACFPDALCVTVGAQSQAATFIATDGQVIGDRIPAQVSTLSCTNPCAVPQ